MHMLTLHFAAILPDEGYGTLEGTFTYETTQGPVEIDCACCARPHPAHSGRAARRSANERARLAWLYTGSTGM